jgi:hypothetical protein
MVLSVAAGSFAGLSELRRTGRAIEDIVDKKILDGPSMPDLTIARSL